MTNDDNQTESKLNRRKTSLLNILLYITIIYIAYLLLGCVIQRRIVFPRHFTRHDPEADSSFPDLDIWSIETDQGITKAWFLASTVDVDEPLPAVIFAYGNADLAESWAPLLKPYRDAGFHVLIPEYRGYGFSDGSPSEKAIVSDFVRFYDKIIEREEVDAGKIFFHGRSLGGGVVSSLTGKRPPAALILSSTFTSIRAMARRYFYPGFLMRDKFDNLEAVRNYDGPVLLLHGREDELTPFHHSQKLKDNAAGKAVVAALPGDHNNIEPYTYGGEAWEHIFAFLKAHELKRRINGS